MGRKHVQNGIRCGTHWKALRRGHLNSPSKGGMEAATQLPFLGLWSSYRSGTAPRCSLHQFGRSLGATDDGHKKTQIPDPLSGLSYSPYIQAVVFLFQVLPSPGRFSSLQNLDSFHSPEGGLWRGLCKPCCFRFGRHSHHPGSLTDLKCNILLSEKLCACSFSVALPAASIFAKQCQNTANPAQSHLLFKQCNSYTVLVCLSKGIHSFGFAPSMHLQRSPLLGS